MTPRALRLLCTFIAACLCLTWSTGCASTRGDISRVSTAPALAHAWNTQLSWGKKFWDGEHYEFSQAAISRDGRTLFVGSRLGDLYALRAADGEVLWRQHFEEPFHGRPLLARGKLYVGNGDGYMRGINANTGEVLWRYDSGGSIHATPAISGDTLIFTNAQDRIFALDLRDETRDDLDLDSRTKFLWQRTRPSRPADFALHGHSGALIHGSEVYTGYSDGRLMAYALSDGATLWSADLSNGRKRFRDVDHTPVVIKDVLYASSFSGGLYAFDLKKARAQRWHHEVEGASGVVEGGGSVVYYSSNEGIHSIDRRRGDGYWTLPLDGTEAPSAPVVSGDQLLISLRDRGLLVLSRGDGGVRAIVNPGGGFSAPPRVLGDRAFVVSNRGGIYAFHLY